MHDSTPIPAGVLTVDDEPDYDAFHDGSRFAARWPDGSVFEWVTAEDRAHLLSLRPEGVRERIAALAAIHQRCEHSTRPRWACLAVGSGRTDTAQFLADRACLPCSLHAALHPEDDHRVPPYQPTPPEPACERCNGRGRVPDSVYEVNATCPACDGSRVHPTPAEPDRDDSKHAIGLDGRCEECEGPAPVEVRTGPLGPRDYLIMPTIVHVMRYRGRNDDGRETWRLACGSHLSADAWDRAGGWTPSLDEIKTHNLATCRRCFPARWDAEDAAPAETLADIVGDMLWSAANEVQGSNAALLLSGFADRIEAAAGLSVPSEGGES